MLSMRCKLLPIFVGCVLLTAYTAARGQSTTLLLWPNGNPEPSYVEGPEVDPTTDATRMLAGKPVTRITNVSKPNLIVYSPDASKNTGAAALAFTGGGYDHLAYMSEGIEVCQWLNSIGMTGILVNTAFQKKAAFRRTRRILRTPSKRCA
jgi:hypothetical protein